MKEQVITMTAKQAAATAKLMTERLAEDGEKQIVLTQDQAGVVHCHALRPGRAKIIGRGAVS